MIDWSSVFMNLYTVRSSARFLDDLIVLIAMRIDACRVSNGDNVIIQFLKANKTHVM